jgi:hypothetical protein
VAPLSAQSFLLQVTIPQSAHDKLRYIQRLLGHAVPTGDLAEVHERAYDALIAQLEKQKFAKASRRGPLRSSTDPRRIPTHVKGTVWERDGGQCTFVAESGEKRAQEAEEKDPDRSVVPWLRKLGCGLEDAREAAAYCATMPPETTMEERIRAALRFLSARRGLVKTAVSAAVPLTRSPPPTQLQPHGARRVREPRIVHPHPAGDPVAG